MTTGARPSITCGRRPSRPSTSTASWAASLDCATRRFPSTRKRTSRSGSLPASASSRSRARRRSCSARLRPHTRTSRSSRTTAPTPRPHPTPRDQVCTGCVRRVVGVRPLPLGRDAPDHAGEKDADGPRRLRPRRSNIHRRTSASREYSPLGVETAKWPFVKLGELPRSVRAFMVSHECPNSHSSMIGSRPCPSSSYSTRGGASA